MEPVQLRKLLKKYLLRQATDEEKKRVTQWYDDLGDSKTPVYLSPTQRQEMAAKLWTGIRVRTAEAGQPIPGAPQLQKPRRKWQWLKTAYWIGTATAFVTIMGLLIWSYTLEPVRPSAAKAAFREKVNQTLALMEVVLEDSTRVWLQPGSSLRYPSPFTSGQREVLLQGEASFTVKRDEKRPFRVYIGQLVIRALESGFTVKTHKAAQTLEVAVEAGRVLVYSQPAFRLQSSDKKATDANTAQAERSGIWLNPKQRLIFYPATTRMVKAEVKD